MRYRLNNNFKAAKLYIILLGRVEFVEGVEFVEFVFPV